MRTIKFIVAILFSIALAACGGGGGGSGSTAPATYSITGTVSGAVTSGVTITLSGAASQTATTDATGNYTFTGLANGSYTVTPSLATYSFSPTGTAVTLSGANVTGKNFTATALGGAATYSISGTVSGDVTSGVTITLGGDNTGSVVTGAGGTYTVSNLIAGNYTVAASLNGYTFNPSTPIAVAIVAADSTANNFVATMVPVPHSISGNVSGTTGVAISVTGTATASTTTDGSGNYTVTGLYDGSYTVTPSKTGYTFNPLSTSVTMAGMNVTGKNFAGTANASVTATANGSITGPWHENVTITMSGGASATTTTNASGNYSFANLPSGQSYTFTPSLAGYTFTNTSETVSVPAGSSTAVTVPAMAAASTVASYSVTGTVSYGGAKTGTINITAISSGCIGCVPAGGTSIAAAGTYTIRGLVPGSYVIQADMDSLGTGARNATNPTGSSATVTITNTDATGANVAMTDPTVPAAATPTGLTVSPADGAAFIQWGKVTDANGTENVTAYKIYWGTDAAATTGTPITVTAHDDTMYVQAVANGATYYKISAITNGVEGTPSGVVGPVTIGATTGNYTVSGSVTFPGTASGGMFVGAYDTMTGAVYFKLIASPSSPQAYSFAGVPNGSYYNFAVVDMNGNGVIDAGDISNTNSDATPLITVNNANLTGSDVTLTSAAATAAANTQFYSDGVNSNYSLDLNVFNGNKPMKTVTVISGPNMPLPLDLGRDWNGFRVWQYTAATPVVGESYVFRVTYMDGSPSQDLTSSVTAVLNASHLAQTPAVSFTAPGTGTVPQFSWLAPATAPAAPYTYRVNVNGSGANWWSNNMSSATTSVLYNADLQANTPALTTATTYNWQIIVNDANGNGATYQAPSFNTP